MKYVILSILLVVLGGYFLSGCAESMVRKCQDLGTVAVKDSKGDDACWDGSSHQLIYPADNNYSPREGRR
jgi:hypothetical protein